ncbi:MAG: hypothetical protein CME65_08710 [Halobacteriovoraceae bacterium]|nr:hypothetical protein [Halobacteriovoraceae bacterium]|tara:strand:+ start:9205 stop:10485 length:1281 start_codon:yes stop_codon:yes gene_type:complete
MKFILLLSLFLTLFGCKLGEEEEEENNLTSSRSNSDDEQESGEGDEEDEESEPEPKSLVMFVSSTKLNGGGTNSFGVTPGLEAFDYACNLDAVDIFGNDEKAFKALLFSSSERVACTSADCTSVEGTQENVDWVLYPNSTYYRTDGTTEITTTNEHAVFNFPLTNNIATSFGDAWTGFQSDWTGIAGNGDSCDGFSTSTGTPSPYAPVGDIYASNMGAIFDQYAHCSLSKSFYCVEVEREEPTGSYKKIFVTTNTYKGGSGLLFADGVSDFDGHCSSEASTKGLSGTYKAMVSAVSGNNGITIRKACSTANCSGSGAAENVNWVLSPNTQYRREDGSAVIGTTNSSGIFDFPLDRSFTGTDVSYWTGTPSSYAVPTIGNAAYTCTDWSINSGGLGYYGNGLARDYKSIYDGSHGCSTEKHILCVEQ